MNTQTTILSKEYDPQKIALILRIGLGILFVVGGWNKLHQLLDPNLVDGILASYTGPRGYINGFFSEFLFKGGKITPWGFLTVLSTFELLSGIAFIAGFMVRPLALIYGFLLWSFVVSLPVSTEAGGNYVAPAALVQIRDIGLSGMMFVLFNLGAGKKSLDNRLFGGKKLMPSWDNLALLLRLSVAIPLIVGGVFYGMADIKTFGFPGWSLFAIGLLISLGWGISVRVGGGILIAMLLYYITTKLNMGKSIIGNLNSIKREISYLAAAGVLVMFGGGALFTAKDVAGRLAQVFTKKAPISS